MDDSKYLLWINDVFDGWGRALLLELSLLGSKFTRTIHAHAGATQIVIGSKLGHVHTRSCQPLHGHAEVLEDEHVVREELITLGDWDTRPVGLTARLAAIPTPIPAGNDGRAAGV